MRRLGLQRAAVLPAPVAAGRPVQHAVVPARATCGRTLDCVFAPEHNGTCLRSPRRAQVIR